MQWLDSLINQMVFLCVMLPVIGAWLVLGVTGLGREAIRRMAFCNVVFSLMLSLLVVANFEASPTKDSPSAKTFPFQMVSNIGWTGTVVREQPSAKQPPAGSNEQQEQEWVEGPDIRISTGVDGISLWFVPLINLTLLSLVVVSWHREMQHPSLYYALLLLLQAALLLVFTALDLIVLLIALHLVLVLNLLLVGKWGSGPSSVLRLPFLTQQLGVWLITLSLAALTLTHLWLWRFPGKEITLTFFIPDLLREMPFLASASPEAALYWRTVSPGICLGLLVGGALLLPLYPFHHLTGVVIHPESAESPLLRRGLLGLVPAYLFLRFLVPLGSSAFELSQGGSTRLAQTMAAWVLISLVLMAFLAVNRKKLSQLVSLLRITQLSMPLLALFALNSLVMTGGVLWLLHVVLSLSLLLFLLETLSRHWGPFEIEDLTGLARRSPRFTIFWCLTVAALAGLPGFSGAVSGGLMLLGTSSWCWWSTGLMVFAQLMLAWALLRVTQTLFQATPREQLPPEILTVEPLHSRSGEDRTGREFDLTKGECLCLLPTVLILLWMGLAPQFFLNRMKATISLLSASWEVRHQQLEPAGDE